MNPSERGINPEQPQDFHGVGLARFARQKLESNRLNTQLKAWGDPMTSDTPHNSIVEAVNVLLETQLALSIDDFFVTGELPEMDTKSYFTDYLESLGIKGLIGSEKDVTDEELNDLIELAPNLIDKLIDQFKIDPFKHAELEIEAPIVKSIAKEHHVLPKDVYENDALYEKLIRGVFQNPDNYAQRKLRNTNSILSRGGLINITRAIVEGLKDAGQLSEDDVEEIMQTLSPTQSHPIDPETQKLMHMIDSVTSISRLMHLELIKQEIVRFWGEDGINQLPYDTLLQLNEQPQFSN